MVETLSFVASEKTQKADYKKPIKKKGKNPNEKIGAKKSPEVESDIRAFK